MTSGGLSREDWRLSQLQLRAVPCGTSALASSLAPGGCPSQLDTRHERAELLSAGRGGAIVIVIVMDAGNTNASEALSTGGNAFLYSRHALLPRLGWFAGREQEVSTF